MRFVRYSSLLSLAAVLMLSLMTSCKHTTEPSPVDTATLHHDSTSCCHGIIEINLKDSSGANVVQASVGLTGENVSKTTITNDDGHARFDGLCPGTYTIHAGKDGYHTIETHVTLTCNDSTFLHLAIGHASSTPDCNAGSITMILRDSATGNAIDGGSASLYKGSLLIATKTISANNTVWDGLTPGLYTIRLSKDGYPVKYITLDSLGCNQARTIDPRWGALHATNADTCTNGRIYVSAHDSTTSSVLIGAVLKIYKGSVLDSTAETSSSSNGVVRFGNLTPGSYRVTVDKDGYHEGVIEFSEECNAMHSYSVALIPTTTTTNCYTTSFVLHFADSTTNANLTGASVTIYNYSTNTSAASGTTTDGGNFSVDGLPGHTTYVVRVSKDGYNAKYMTYTITDCRQVNETILVSPH